MVRSEKPREPRLVLRSVHHARGLFLLAVAQLEPRVLESLSGAPLRIHRELFRRQARAPLIDPDRARRLGWEDEVIDENEAACAELGDECVLDVASSGLRYPLLHWRDPTPDPQHGEQRRLNRMHFGLSLPAYAKLENCLPSELLEMERGRKPRDGLTTTTGAEPLRLTLGQWASRWHLTADWCLDWALQRLSPGPSEEALEYPLDPVGTVLSQLHLPGWGPHLQTWESYRAEVDDALVKYRASVERSIEDTPLERVSAKRRRDGRSADRHFYWLAGYQVCNWSQNRITEAEGMDPSCRPVVVRAIHKLAALIGLAPRRREPGQRSPSAATIRSALPVT